MQLISKIASLSVLLFVCDVSSAKDQYRPLLFAEIKPSGWLKEQMSNDMDIGFVGNLDKLVPDLIQTDDIYGKNRLTKKVKSTYVR